MTDSVNSRELVLAILLAVTKDGIYSHVAISDVLTKYQYLCLLYTSPSPRDA